MAAKGLVIIRDDVRIARLASLSKYLNLIGMLALIGGLVLAFVGREAVLGYQLLALLVGWIMSQVGIYLAHKYVRDPRPDEVLDQALAKAVKDGRLYHYVLPAPHVLLTRSGIIVLVAKYQIGKITANGDKWKQSGVGLRRFFGQEGLGNPTREADAMVGAVANFVRKHAPTIEEVPIAPMIVFTTKGIAELDVSESRIPAMYFGKVKGFLRQQPQLDPLPPEEYQALRAAFDQKASDFLPQEALAGSVDPE